MVSEFANVSHVLGQDIASDYGEDFESEEPPALPAASRPAPAQPPQPAKPAPKDRNVPGRGVGLGSALELYYIYIIYTKCIIMLYNDNVIYSRLLQQ